MTTYDGRLASYRVTEPGLVRLVVEFDYDRGVEAVAVEVPADVLAGIVSFTKRHGELHGERVPGQDMRCAVCGHEVEYVRGDLTHRDRMTHAYQHTAVLVSRPDMTAPLLPYALSGEGHSEGVEYVTVIDAGGNPVEYNIPRSQAVERYAAELDC